MKLTINYLLNGLPKADTHDLVETGYTAINVKDVDWIRIYRQQDGNIMIDFQDNTQDAA